MDINELYASKDGEHCWQSDCALDNIESMESFLEEFGLHENVVLNDGTEVLLYQEGKREVVVLESYGKGDTFSHAVSYRLEYLGDHLMDDDVKARVDEINGGPLTEECYDCRGSGMGRYDGTNCNSCHGSGVHVVFGSKK